ncbi:hypothetical protein [Polyangium spumosum]|uniref:Tetratricopeptide repeat protein n=1 Tax=Polyangium spumosum TaxID=889282 RepID=A0A6N7PRY3_9BACT|nr:hypothetical protein [Polyangium spumosum]MRG94699.1 hypothetical protein [Polyangium spumosum]
MRSGLLFTNGILLAGIAAVLTIGPGTHGKRLLPADAAAVSESPVDMAALESAASLAPTVESVVALASAYVDRGQPGLASAVIEKAPRKIQLDPRVADVSARALFHRGQARKALAAVEDAIDACDAEEVACRSWQVAKAERQAAFLKEVVAAGVEDPMTDPAAVRAAYERSTQKVGLVAMR